MYCLNHLAQLGRLHGSLSEQQTHVLGIGPSDAKTTSRIAGTLQLPFPLLTDPNREVYTAFGFRRIALLLQRSGTVLVERSGTIRYVNREANPQRSLRKGELLEAVAALQGDGGRSPF